MVKEIDFGEEKNYRRTTAQKDSFGIASLLLRYHLATSQRQAAQMSKLLLVAIVIVCLLSIVLLRPWNDATPIPEDAYFDPAIHNTDDEPL